MEDIVFYTILFICNILAIFLCLTTNCKTDQLLLLIWIIPQFYMLYSMNNGNMDVRNQIHNNIFFYYIAITPFLFRDKKILQLMLFVYIATLITRYYFNRCIFVTKEEHERKNNKDKHKGIWGTFNFHEKNLVMVLVMISILYKLTY